MDESDRIDKLELLLDDVQGQLFNLQSDMKYMSTENTALKDFLGNLYYSCKELEETEIQAEDLIKNLRQNIEVFAKDHKIRL
ncbi:MAG: hypothetical protein R8G66_27100 [Cytophagales bacterium]|nr:hypothetical protein [Cytophagales bacterium]